MFTVQNLQINRGTTTANAQGKFTTTIHTFKDVTSTVAIIRAYFPDYLNQGATQDFLSVGDHMLVIGSDTSIFCQILSLAPFTMGTDLFSGASGLSVGVTIPAVDNNAAVITGDTLQMEIADFTHAGIMTSAAQNIGGAKTFQAQETIIAGNDFVPTVSAPALGVTVRGDDVAPGYNVHLLNPAQAGVYSFVAEGAGEFGFLWGSPNGLLSFVPEVAMFCPLGPFSAISCAADGVVRAVGSSMQVQATLEVDIVNSLTSFSAISINGGMNVDAANVNITATSLNVDTINNLTPSLGTTINGTNIKGTTIALADPNVYIDNGVAAVNQIRFNFSTINNDFLNYNKVSRSFLYAVGNIAQFAISSSECDILPVIVAGTGIELPTVGGVTGLLDYYEETTFTTTFTNNLQTTGVITFKVIRTGKNVCLTSATVGSTVAQVAPVANYQSNTVLPVNYRPAVDVIGFWRTTNGTTQGNAGIIQINTSGIIDIYFDADTNTTFNAGLANGFDVGAISYNIT